MTPLPPPPPVEIHAPAPAPPMNTAAPFATAQVMQTVRSYGGATYRQAIAPHGRPMHTRHHKGKRHASQRRRSNARKARRR